MENLYRIILCIYSSYTKILDFLNSMSNDILLTKWNYIFKLPANKFATFTESVRKYKK